MSREPQRVLTPSDVYEDMRRGTDVSIPAEFPYTWETEDLQQDAQFNPPRASGVGSVRDDLFLPGMSGVGALQDDLFKFGQDLLQQGQEKAGEIVKGKIPPALTKAIEDAAQAGVVKEVKKHAPNLLLFAVAGGAIGGALSAKLGKTGTVLAIGLAVWSGMQMMQAAKEGAKK
jgi:hypothetical protein